MASINAEKKVQQKKRIFKLVETSVLIIAIFFSVFHIYTSGFGTLASWIQRPLCLLLVMVLAFIRYPIAKKVPRNYFTVTLDFALIILAVFASIYVMLEYLPFCYYRVASPTLLDTIIGIVLIGLTLEVTRRTQGPILPLIALFSLLYVLFIGQFLPEPFTLKAFSLQRVVTYLTLTEAEGIFGSLLDLGTVMLVIYMILGAALEVTGAGDFIIDLAKGSVGRIRGGPAHTANLASLLFGLVQGSSNVVAATVGTLTIPMMKSSGYSSRFAAAIVSASATAAQLTPPIMGAVAFIMAQIVGVPYARVALAAFIPAFLYFLTMAFAIDAEARLHNLKGISSEAAPKMKQVIRKGWPFIIPLAVLVYLLLIASYSVQASAFYALIVNIAIFFLMRPRQWRQNLKALIKILERGALSSISIIALLATAGIIVGCLALSGQLVMLYNTLIVLSRGSAFILLTLAMVICIILGMGLNTSSAYILTTLVVGPALATLNIDPFIANMFILYYAVMGALTPPICATPVVTAAITGENYLKIAIEGCKIAFPVFLLPYAFIFDPALLLIGTPIQIFTGFILTAIGALLTVSSLKGILIKELSIIERAIAIVGGILLLLHPSLEVTIIGSLIFVVLVASGTLSKILKRKATID
ncbi:MAG: TRAP transporter fused permease subunit [Candidatus Bathyarchaeia archaeon]